MASRRPLLDRLAFSTVSFTAKSDPSLYDACLECRARLLWSKEKPPLTASDYAEADNEATFFACLASGDCRVLGTAMLHDGRIRQVVVITEARGYGVGSALVNAVANAAKNGGCTELHVSAWASSERFYARCGFWPVGDTYESNGIVCQKMALPLKDVRSSRPAVIDSQSAHGPPPSPPPSPPPPESPPSRSRLFYFSRYTSWLLLGFVFAAAGYQGADFASTKPVATVWGGVIGLAAFFAWLAVDEEEIAGYEEDGDYDDEDYTDDDDDDGSPGASERPSSVKPPEKID